MTIAVVRLNDGRVANYAVPDGTTYFRVKSDAEDKLRNFGDNRSVMSVEFIKAENTLDGTASRLVTRAK
jgi:hypothetical protein